MKFTYLLLVFFILSCSSSYRDLNMFSNLNDCLINSNIGSKEIKIDLDSAIIIYKNRLRLEPTSLFLSKREVFEFLVNV